MRRLAFKVIFFCLIFGLPAAVNAEKFHEGNLHRAALPEIVPDTSVLFRLLDVTPFNLPVIAPSLGVQFYMNDLVFLSDSKDETRMLSKHVSFGTVQAYTAQIGDTTVGKHMIFSPLNSFPYPCEAITFSADYKTMYFTKIPDKEKKEKIYRAVLSSGSWTADANPLDFCKGNYSYSHPALSSDGKIMIFASDKDGTKGGMDLFMVKQDGDSWSAPENLGNTINTVRFEFFPFLDSDNNLYFSSDGLPGFGGFDIFTCKFNGHTWEKPENLSNRINTEADDIAFYINKTDGKTAFFTTRKKSGKNEMQLFRVSLNKKAVDDRNITISYIYNGKIQQKPVSAAVIAEADNKPAEPEKAKEKTKPELKEDINTVPEKKTAIETDTRSSQPAAKIVNIKSTTALPENLKDVVIYRVQFFSSAKQRKENKIIINGVSYDTYEYFYLNLYRYTIGEFTTLAPALELKAICRKAGYPEAFVAAFKNDTRSLDLKIFK